MPKRKVFIILDSDDEGEENNSTNSTQNVIEILDDSPRKKNKQQQSKVARRGTGKRKRNHDDDDFIKKPTKRVCRTPGSATKFQIPSNFKSPSQSPSPSPSPKDSAPILSDELWIDKYQPKTSTELPVHKKKVTEVRTWLEKSLLHLPLGTPNTPRMLILTGPTGGCKTTLIQVLCRELRSELCEWIDPSLCLWKDSDAQLLVPYTSRMKAFRDFMLRIERYRSIQVEEEEPMQEEELAVSSEHLHNKKVILLEQLPYLHDEEQRKDFNEVVNDFLSSSRFPMVFIMSDESFGSSSLHRLLNSNILSSQYVNIININPVAPTIVVRTLKKICMGERMDVPVDKLEQMGEASGGDIRNAVNSLQFFCRTRTRASRPVTYSLSLRNSQTNSQKKEDGLLGSRDSSYSLFHAVGKFCHHKREDSKILTDETFQEEFYRNAPTFSPTEVLKTTHVPPWTFNAFLHENYLMFQTDIHETAQAAEYLSDADVIDGSLNYPYRADNRINSYIDTIAARGVLYSNTSPPSKKFQSIYSPLAFQASYKQRDLRAMADYLFIRGSTSSSELRRQSSLLGPSRILLIDVLPFLKKILCGPKSNGLISLTQGQKTGLDLLTTFSTAYKRSAIDKNAHDEGVVSEATLLKNLTQKCYSQHQQSSKNEENSLLLKVGGRLNEVLEEDDIVDFDD